MERPEDWIGRSDQAKKSQPERRVSFDASNDRDFPGRSPILVSIEALEPSIQRLSTRKTSTQVRIATLEGLFVSPDLFILSTEPLSGSTEGLLGSTEGLLGSTEGFFASTDGLEGRL
jgi:hypothetical protein